MRKKRHSCETFSSLCQKKGYTRLAPHMVLSIEASDVVARTRALMSKIETKEKPSEPAAVTALGAHRPPGTAAAAAALTADADALRVAQAEERNAALKAQMRELQQICSETTAEEESGGQHSAKRKKLESAISRLVTA